MATRLLTGALAALLPARDGTAGEPPLNPRAWRASVVGLHLSFIVVIALAVTSLLVGPQPVAGYRWSLGALGVLSAGYLLIGARALASRSPVGAMLYLPILVATVGVISWNAPDVLFLLFLAYPQVWFLVEGTRPGAIWTGLLAISSTIGLTFAAIDSGHPATLGWTSTAIGFLFSILMGVWISRVLDQSRQRAELIAQLEATRAELAAAHHAQGVTTERERLAQEVHDTLAQGYTSIVMLAQTALTQLENRPAVARERIELIEEVARENLSEARRVVRAFAPPALDGTTLIEAIRRLADRFEREAGVPVVIELPAAVGLDRDGEVVLLRATQETLTNVRRHASATGVRIRLVESDAAIVLSVSDDGIGFDTTTASGDGLAGLRGRVGQAGGSVLIDAAPGRGTSVTVELPSIAS